MSASARWGTAPGVSVISRSRKFLIHSRVPLFPVPMGQIHLDDVDVGSREAAFLKALMEPLVPSMLFLFDAEIVPKNRDIGAGACIGLYGLGRSCSLPQPSLGCLSRSLPESLPRSYDALVSGNPARINERVIVPEPVPEVPQEAVHGPLRQSDGSVRSIGALYRAGEYGHRQASARPHRR